MMEKHFVYEITIFFMLVFRVRAISDDAKAISDDLIQAINRNFDEFKANQQRDYYTWSQILERRLDSIASTFKDGETGNSCDCPGTRGSVKDGLDKISKELAEIKTECFKKSKELRLTKLGDKTYYFATDFATSWSLADEFCRTNGMKFIQIESEEKNQIIVRQIKILSGGDYWISGTDLGSEGKFYWINDNQPIDKWKPWAENEPSNYNGNENCIEIRSWDYKWNDADCNVFKRFICEL